MALATKTPQLDPAMRCATAALCSRTLSETDQSSRARQYQRYMAPHVLSHPAADDRRPDSSSCHPARLSSRRCPRTYGGRWSTRRINRDHGAGAPGHCLRKDRPAGRCDRKTACGGLARRTAPKTATTATVPQGIGERTRLIVGPSPTAAGRRPPWARAATIAVDAACTSGSATSELSMLRVPPQGFFSGSGGRRSSIGVPGS